jgi:hypothetical protein
VRGSEVRLVVPAAEGERFDVIDIDRRGVDIEVDRALADETKPALSFV